MNLFVDSPFTASLACNHPRILSSTLNTLEVICNKKKIVSSPDRASSEIGSLKAFFSPISNRPMSAAK